MQWKWIWFLEQFSGGIATVFTNSIYVEFDPSVFGWEKYEYRNYLTDFSLKGIMHFKQWKHLQALSNEIKLYFPYS